MRGEGDFEDDEEGEDAGDEEFEELKHRWKIATGLRSSWVGKVGSHRKEDDEMEMLKNMFGGENAGVEYSRLTGRLRSGLKEWSTESEDPVKAFFSKASTSSRDSSSL
eukprot:3622945-Heterocapsa_arctica.AAC.1